MNKPDLSLYDNAHFNPGRSVFIRFLWYLVNSFIFKSYWLPINKVKVAFLRLFGAKIGEGVVIKPNVSVKYPWNLIVGNNTWIGEGVWIDNLVLVTIGSNCCISQNALLFCGNHNYKKTTFDLMTDGIALKEGSWVGANATVCPGVVLHENAILTAGSTATSAIGVCEIAQGNPAKKVKIRKLDES